NAQVVADTVAAPIEQQIKGVDKMRYLLSRYASDGTCTLTATCAPGVDLDAAHVQVTKRVISAHSALPDVVKRGGVTIKKKPAHVLQLIAFSSPGGTYGTLYLSNYATLQVRSELVVVPHVSDVVLF